MPHGVTWLSSTPHSTEIPAGASRDLALRDPYGNPSLPRLQARKRCHLTYRFRYAPAMELSKRWPVVLLFALTACDGESFDERFGGEGWTSEHFTYRYQPEDPFVCPEVLESLEAAAAVTYDAFGIDRSRWSRTTYYKYPEREAAAVGGPCSEGAQGCARASRVVAVHPFQLHEVVHNVVAKTSGVDVPLLLAEGAAAAFGCYDGLSTIDSDWDWREFEYAGEGSVLPLAGRLVLGLSTLIGMPAIAEALAALSAAHDPFELDAWLKQRHGIGLDAAWAAAVSKDLGSCLPLYGCTGAELPAGHSELTAGCHGFDARTLPRRPGEVWTVNATGSLLRTMPCEASATHPLVAVPLTRSDGKQVVLELPSVSHAVLFDGYPRSRFGQYSAVEATRVTATPGTTCDQSPVLTMTPGQGLAIVLSSSEVRHYRITLDGPKSVRLTWAEAPEPDMTLAWCADCSSLAQGRCASVPHGNGGTAVVEAGASNVLVVTPGVFARAVVIELSPEVAR